MIAERIISRRGTRSEDGVRLGMLLEKKRVMGCGLRMSADCCCCCWGRREWEGEGRGEDIYRRSCLYQFWGGTSGLALSGTLYLFIHFFFLHLYRHAFGRRYASLTLFFFTLLLFFSFFFLFFSPHPFCFSLFFFTFFLHFFFSLSFFRTSSCHMSSLHDIGYTSQSNSFQTNLLQSSPIRSIPVQSDRVDPSNSFQFTGIPRSSFAVVHSSATHSHVTPVGFLGPPAAEESLVRSLREAGPCHHHFEFSMGVACIGIFSA